VGKSCLSIQASRKEFEKNYISTIGFEFFSFNVRINDKTIKLQIWDTCGQEAYKSLVISFYRNSSLAIVVFTTAVPSRVPAT
jgi:small GTP-binding protein